MVEFVLFVLFAAVYAASALDTAPSIGDDQRLRRNQEDASFWFGEEKKGIEIWRFGPPQGIVGGTPASDGEFPYMASLEVQGFGIICGASLLSPTKVLSAAHCFFDTNDNIVLPDLIRIGHIELLVGGEVATDIDCVAIHPNYTLDYTGAFNDLAVVTLGSPVNTTSFATLNADANYPSESGQELTAIGFGQTSTDGPLSDDLLKVTLGYVTAETCQNDFQCIDDEYHVCVNAPDAGSCFGDSGGPLVDDAGVQVGLSSFVSGTHKLVIYGTIRQITGAL